jgi:hypothetical protein
MRSVTAPQTAVLSGTIRKHSVNVYVKDSDAVYQNLSNISDFGFDFVQAIQITESIDTPVSILSLTLITKMFYFSLCPEISNKLNKNAAGQASALLQLNSLVKITASTVAEGIDPGDSDWENIFEGYITKINISSNGRIINLECRDLGARLQDTFIREENIYGANDGSVLAEDVIQSILDDNGLSDITLYTPVASDFAIREYTQERKSVMDALTEIALQAGFNIRYKWDDGTEAWRLTFFEPDRTKTVADFTFPASLYCAVPTYNYDIYSIRNLITVVFNSLGSSGTATGAAAGQLDDSDQTWTANEYIGDSIVITGGTGVGQERTVWYNTATVLGITPNWTITPNSCCTYKIISRRKEITYPENGTASSVSTGKLVDDSKGWYLNQWAGYDLYIYDGTGEGNSYSIDASSYTSLTPATTWITQPTSGDLYAIVNSNDTGDGLYLYGPRWMSVTEAAGSQIDTKTEGRAMARAIYSDLSRFNKAIQIEVDFFYPAQLGDLYTFSANDVIFDSDLTLAVIGITHKFGSDMMGRQKNTTVLELRGQPSGGYLSWFYREGTPGVAPTAKFPETPSNLAVTTGQDVAGVTSYVKCTWDYNPELDLEYYQIRYQTGSAEWSYMAVPAFYNTVKIPALKTSTSYDFQLRAVNKNGKTSSWTSSSNITTAA